MIVNRRIPLGLILRVEGRQILLFAVLATAVYVVQRVVEFDVSLPLTVVMTIGTAVAVLLGFKNSAAYQRWWEGRRIWGAITDTSRKFATQLLAFLDFKAEGAEDREPLLRELARRHLAYVNVLRRQLRSQDTDEELSKWLPEEECRELGAARNQATLIMTHQSGRLRELRDKGMLEEFRFYPLQGTLEALFDKQGQAEQLDSTPLMRHYSYFTTAFVWIFVVLLPFGFAPVLGWATLPLVVLISTVFTMLDRAGSFTEDPYCNEMNDVPLTAICRDIEIDLLQQLGLEPVPEPIEPENGILM